MGLGGPLEYTITLVRGSHKQRGDREETEREREREREREEKERASERERERAPTAARE